ncbi:MAG: hypothetical protein JWQ11_2197 [Rhizobacter sp.]|nr:hypothetical protein [Rhizobacter sp.]
MSNDAWLIDQVLASARAAGFDQASLARAAGVAPETISRAKRRGTIDLRTLVALAEVAGSKVTLSNAPASQAPVAQAGRRRSTLADPVHGLSWSNPDMSDEALVRNALAKGSFNLVLEATLEHGLDSVRKQWALMKADADIGLNARARAEVDRELVNIERGLRLAEA